jgi:V8-like Glu-specific endopeptidase
MTTPSDLLVAFDKDDDAIKKLGKIMARKAADDPNPKAFIRDIIRSSNLPEDWKLERIDVLDGVPVRDFKNLFRWAIGKGLNKDDVRYTAIGSLMKEFLETVGPEEGRYIASLIVAYCLYRDKELLMALMTANNIPIPAEGSGGFGCGGASISLPMGQPAGAGQITGPPINWQGPDDDKTLEGWFQSEPEFYDAGFWRRAADRTDAVCLVKLVSRKRSGTGFLIAPDLLISNYHVFRDMDKGETEDDLQANIKDTTLRFDYVTGDDGDDETGVEFKLAQENSLLAASLTDELDFVLVRVEEKIKTADGIKHIEYNEQPLGIGSGLNIIQHPAGGTMKIALSSNKVAYTSAEGIIQYASKTAGGSSGSPCFNDKWELVALHHASVSTSFGSRREGILFKNIYEKIKGTY